MLTGFVCLELGSLSSLFASKRYLSRGSRRQAECGMNLKRGRQCHFSVGARYSRIDLSSSPSSRAILSRKRFRLLLQLFIATAIETIVKSFVHELLIDLCIKI